MNKIAFIGAGNMNGAIILGLLNGGTAPTDIMVSNPSPEKREKLRTKFMREKTNINKKMYDC